MTNDNRLNTVQALRTFKTIAKSKSVLSTVLPVDERESRQFSGCFRWRLREKHGRLANTIRFTESLPVVRNTPCTRERAEIEMIVDIRLFAKLKFLILPFRARSERSRSFLQRVVPSTEPPTSVETERSTYVKNERTAVTTGSSNLTCDSNSSTSISVQRNDDRHRPMCFHAISIRFALSGRRRPIVIRKVRRLFPSSEIIGRQRLRRFTGTAFENSLRDTIRFSARVRVYGNGNYRFKRLRTIARSS